MNDNIKADPRKVINVGGGSKDLALPPQYSNWEHILLDIDPRGRPDIICDARDLTGLSAGEYDAVYCAHNLEHYYRHDAYKVLRGFIHILKEDGFSHIRVPDLDSVMRAVVENSMDIGDTLYQSLAGPITVRDVIYGYEEEIEQTGNDFYAHKTGFTTNSLRAMLHECGFPYIFTNVGNFEITAIAFLKQPSATICKSFDLSSMRFF